jgi:hypothetical protein
MAQQERLGDVRLYRVPITVTVAARSQKQIALLREPAVRVENIVRLRPTIGPIDDPLERVLVTRNRATEGLGLPLPAGKVAVFGKRQGRRILLGEGRIDDYAVGEKVVIPVASTPAVRARQIVEEREGHGPFLLTLTNDLPVAQTAEIELPLEARPQGGIRLVKRDGWLLWRVTVPANGSVQLRYTMA